MANEQDLSVTDILRCAKVLQLYWCTSLTHPEFKLLSWIFGNTVLRGKTWGYYSINQMVEGIRCWTGERTYWCFGSGLSKSTVIRTLASLKTKGVLFSEPGKPSNYYCVNLDWEPWTEPMQVGSE